MAFAPEVLDQISFRIAAGETHGMIEVVSYEPSLGISGEFLDKHKEFNFDYIFDEAHYRGAIRWSPKEDKIAKLQREIAEESRRYFSAPDVHVYDEDEKLKILTRIVRAFRDNKINKTTMAIPILVKKNLNRLCADHSFVINAFPDFHVSIKIRETADEGNDELLVLSLQRK